MTSRREFLEAALLAAMPLPAGAVPATAAPAAASGTRLALLESASPEARLFGTRLAARGARLHEVPPQDLAPLWFGQIRPLWNRGPAPVAGLTFLSTLFCLEQLAWAHGLRVVFHAEHLSQGGTVSHVLQRGAGLAWWPRLAASAQAWPLVIADALGVAPPHEGARPGPSLAGLEPSIPSGARLLASWLIA